jgi:hypothetical protein
MSEIALASINTFGQSPKADIVPSDDPILEIHASELQHFFDDLILTFNKLADLLPKRERDEMKASLADALHKNEGDPKKCLQVLCDHHKRARDLLTRRV